MPNSSIGIGDGADTTSDATDHRLDILEYLTSDLHAGIPASGWLAATDAAQGGIAVVPVALTLMAIRALPDDQWALVNPNAAGRHVIVRIPSTASPAQVRINFVGRDADETYFPTVNSLTRIGESADAQWQFFGTAQLAGADVVRTILEVTGSAAHVGTSTYRGNLDRSKVYAIVKEMLQGSVTPNDSAETITV